MELIDTHCHLTMKAYEGRLEGVLARAREAGVTRWITVASEVADSRAVVGLCEKYQGMYGTVGVHPHEAGKAEAGYIEELRKLSRGAKVCAIGEVGLDYHYEFSERRPQQRVLREQLELAGQEGLPVVVHCREAFADCMGILREWQNKQVNVVFHCFMEGVAELKEVLDRGWYISLGGILTFKKAEKMRQVAGYVPLERVLLETDCPYLAPEPKRGKFPNEPAWMVHTAAKLAETRGMNGKEIAEVVEQNSRYFFKLDTIEKK